MVEVRLGNVEGGLGNVEGLREIVEARLGNAQHPTSPHLKDSTKKVHPHAFTCIGVDLSFKENYPLIAANDFSIASNVISISSSV